MDKENERENVNIKKFAAIKRNLIQRNWKQKGYGVNSRGILN
jgi:hypothetical protein